MRGREEAKWGVAGLREDLLSSLMTEARLMAVQEEAGGGMDVNGFDEDLPSSLMSEGMFEAGREGTEWGVDGAGLREDLLLSWM